MEYMIPNKRFYLKLDQQQFDRLNGYLASFNGNRPGGIYYKILDSGYFTVCVVQSFENHDFTRVMKEAEQATNPV